MGLDYVAVERVLRLHEIELDNVLLRRLRVIENAVIKKSQPKESVDNGDG